MVVAVTLVKDSRKTKNSRDCVNIGLDSVKFTAKIDGVEVMTSENRDDFLPDPHLYNITFNEDNLYDADPGTFRAMANGYFIFLKPLSVGSHTLEFSDDTFNLVSKDNHHQKIDFPM